MGSLCSLCSRSLWWNAVRFRGRRVSLSSDIGVEECSHITLLSPIEDGCSVRVSGTFPLLLHFPELQKALLCSDGRTGCAALP
jgi:uncharacterized protein (DUF608 family)